MAGVGELQSILGLAMATKARSIKQSKFYVRFDIHKHGSFVRRQSIASSVIKIGSLESQSGIYLDDRNVSPLHATIMFGENGEAMIVNLSSISGTFLNGDRVAKSALRNGDKIEIGDNSLTIWFGKGENELQYTVSECLQWLEEEQVTVLFNIGCVNAKHEKTGIQCSAERFELVISQLRKMVSKKL